MKTFLDTNVLLDFFIIHRRNQNPSSEIIIDRIFKNELKGLISSTTFLNFNYIMEASYKLKKEEIRKILFLFLEAFELIEINQEDLKNALALNWNDFEDACQYIAAQKANSDVIVSADKKGFKNSVIPIFSTKEFHQKFILNP